MPQIPRALDCTAYLLMWWEGAFCEEHLAVPSPFNFPQFSSVTAAYLLGVVRDGSWLGRPILPAIRAVSILELAANSGSSRMSQAPNLHLMTQLLTR